MAQEINQSIGHKIRAFRLVRGVNQSQLADSLGVSCQQLQKYEHGQNRMSVEKLCNIAKYLSIPVSTFLDESVEPLEIDNIRQSLALMQSVNALSHRQRQALITFVRTLVKKE